MNDPPERGALERKLAELKATHRALDSRIQQLIADGMADALEIQRLKKTKLQLKDKIALLSDMLLPDIIA
jgi:hypothetical protein